MNNDKKIDKHTLKILRCKYCKIFKLCLTIFIMCEMFKSFLTQHLVSNVFNLNTRGAKFIIHLSSLSFNAELHLNELGKFSRVTPNLWGGANVLKF